MNPQTSTLLHPGNALAWMFAHYRIGDPAEERRRQVQQTKLSQRQAGILLLIRQNATLRSDQIIGLMPVHFRSAACLRRDIAELNRQGMIVKTGRQRIDSPTGKTNTSIYRLSEYGLEQLSIYLRHDPTPLENEE